MKLGKGSIKNLVVLSTKARGGGSSQLLSIFFLNLLLPIIGKNYRKEEKKYQATAKKMLPSFGHFLNIF